MSNIIRIRDLQTENTPSNDTYIPIDNDGYNFNAKKMTMLSLKNYISSSNSSSCLSYNAEYSTSTPSSGQMIFDVDNHLIKIHKFDLDGVNQSTFLEIKFKSKQFGLVWSDIDKSEISGQYVDQCEYHIFDIQCIEDPNPSGLEPYFDETGETFVKMDVVYSESEYGIKHGGRLVSRVGVYVDAAIVFTDGIYTPTGVKYEELVYRRTNKYNVETVDQSILALNSAYQNGKRPNLGVGYGIYVNSGLTIDAPLGYYMSYEHYTGTTKQNCAEYQGSGNTVSVWGNKLPGWNFIPDAPSGDPNYICSITGSTLAAIDIGDYYEIPWVSDDAIGNYINPSIYETSLICIDMSGMQKCVAGGSVGDGSVGVAETLTYLMYDDIDHKLFYEDEEMYLTIINLNVGDLSYDEPTKMLTYTAENGNENIIEIGGSETLSGLTDTTIDSLVCGDVLIWDCDTGMWVNSAVTFDSGTDGTSGSSGTDGTSGSSGTDGTSGSSGTDGTSGSSGTDGASGSSGTDGTSGSSGTDGTSGSSGTDGTSGSSGTDGTSGSSGTDGTSGSSGTG